VLLCVRVRDDPDYENYFLLPPLIKGEGRVRGLNILSQCVRKLSGFYGIPDASSISAKIKVVASGIDKAKVPDAYNP